MGFKYDENKNEVCFDAIVPIHDYIEKEYVKKQLKPVNIVDVEKIDLTFRRTSFGDSKVGVQVRAIVKDEETGETFGIYSSSEAKLSYLEELFDNKGITNEKQEDNKEGSADVT